MDDIKNTGCIVVGDIYASFADGVNASNVIRESDVLAMFANDQVEFSSLILGQGLSRRSVKTLTELATIYEIDCETELLNAASPYLTHKSAIENILISDPQNCGGRLYKHQLIIDNCFDRLSDHVTGKHIGAMLLIEAARQAVISTLQIEYPETEDGVPWGFVLQKFDTEYSDYAFPIPTDIFVKLEQADVGKNGRQVATSLSIRFYQNSSCISQMSMDVQLIDKETLNKLEGMKSKKVSAALLSQDEHLNRGKLVGAT